MDHPQQHILWDSIKWHPSAALACQCWQTLHTAIVIRIKLHRAVLRWNHLGNSHFTNIIPLFTLYMQANSHHRKIPFRGNRLCSTVFWLLQCHNPMVAQKQIPRCTEAKKKGSWSSTGNGS